MVKHQTNVLQTGLPAYTGEWTFTQAAHLLRRTIFGPKKAEIVAAVDQGLAATVTALLAAQPAPEPPVNHNYPDDPNVAIGESWTTLPSGDAQEILQYRIQSYRSWIFQQALADTTIREKMVLFWQNHFGLTFNGNPITQFQWNALLREHATGDFRQLIKDVTINPAMLQFLNGTQSSANAPNENYGRELLELFTIGKGPQIGEGDYSNYTEDDVRALTRALTGWRVMFLNPVEPGQFPTSVFINNRHDSGDKQLSYHFNDQVITNAGAEEYKSVVDIILAEMETARYMVREFYRYFVYYDISPEEETTVIEPLAQFFFDSDYDIAATLENLFLSEHFYDTLNRGPMIKDPMSYALSNIRSFGYDHVESTLESDTIFHLRLYFVVQAIGLDYLSPPSVSGWEAWYQAPVFHRSWINASTLQQRTTLVERLTANGFNIGGVRYSFDFIEWISALENPYEPDPLIEEASRLLLPEPLVAEQLAALKDVLIPGLPDFEWTDEYGLYLADPTDMGLRASVENKLKNLFGAIFGLAEYHLS